MATWFKPVYAKTETVVEDLVKGYLNDSVIGIPVPYDCAGTTLYRSRLVAKPGVHALRIEDDWQNDRQITLYKPGMEYLVWASPVEEASVEEWQEACRLLEEARAQAMASRIERRAIRARSR